MVTDAPIVPDGLIGRRFFRGSIVRILIALVLQLATSIAGRAASFPSIDSILPSGAVIESAPETTHPINAGDTVGKWTLMATINVPGEGPAAVFEDFTELRGHMIVVAGDKVIVDLPKSLAPSAASAEGLYRGHSLEEVMKSTDDLLGREILARPGDPRFDEVAAYLPPISRMFTYTFVGTGQSTDKIGFAYGGRSPAFDPAIWVPAIREIRDRRAVADGLVGGWLPIVRFVYPESDDAWTELLAYAPPRVDNRNPRVQPVWYRVARVERGELRWARTVDTYVPFPPRGEPSGAGFYEDLLKTKSAYEASLQGAMRISVPDQRLADMAKHSLIRAMMTRDGAEPHYGVVDRNYGGSEHDGFPDTFNTEVGTFCDWGVLDRAGAYIDNFFGQYVRDDGSLLYRGPETGQYGRMLTVLAQYVHQGGDPAIVLKHRGRIEAVASLLLSLRRSAQELPPTHAAYGMIAGWSEADSAIDPDPARYMQPYFGNSAEAARGFRDFGQTAERLGRAQGDATLTRWGRTLIEEAESLEYDLQQSIARSILKNYDPVCLPAIAGAPEPFHIAVPRDPLDPLHRGYRSYMEMLFSGLLTREQTDLVVSYRAAHADSIVGLPTAYGYRSNEVAGFLTYGQAYGLLQHDRIRDYLLTLYSLMAHQYTRGTWTAPETRNIDPKVDAAPYCVPAQLTVPMLTRWMLAFEDPRSETLWLAKGTPREWLRDGLAVSAADIPTRWGRIGFLITSQLAAGRIKADVELPPGSFPAAIRLRLRTPEGHRLALVEVNGRPWADFEPALEVINLPTNFSGPLSIVASYEQITNTPSPPGNP
jgi:hypothetical protein